jgi:hypothetical protein
LQLDLKGSRALAEHAVKDVYQFCSSYERAKIGVYLTFMMRIVGWTPTAESPMWTSKNRGRYDRSKLRYPSDLTDAEWGLVEPLIPPGKTGGGKRTVIMREVVNGLMYILSTGCPSTPRDALGPRPLRPTR